MIHYAFNEYVRTKVYCHVLESACHCENGDRGNHCLEALGNTFHSVLEGDNTAADEVNDSDNESDDTAERKTYCCVCVTECVNKACTVEESANIDKSENGNDDENDDRDKKVEYTALFVYLDTAFVSVFCTGCEEVTLSIAFFSWIAIGP